MFRPGALILHGTAVGVMTYGFLAIKMSPVDELIRANKGGYSQYLTILGLWSAWLTMVISLGCDLLPSFAALRAAKRAFLMISLPLEMLISGVYWSLVLLFPSLILQQLAASESSSQIPPGLLKIPPRIDFCIHITPVVSLLVDFLFFEKRFTRKQVQIHAPVVILTVGACYCCWVEYCATFNETFPYPFLTENPLDVRIAIYMLLVFVTLGCFRLLNAVHA